MRRTCACGCGERIAQPSTGRPRLYASEACCARVWRRRHRKLRGALEVMGSSRSDEWPTDPEVFAALDAELGPFTLDACATEENAKCPKFYTREDDGLAQPWTGRVWVNPPYGTGIGAWVRKAHEATACGEAERVVLLLPARVDTRWWHDYVDPYAEHRFIRGRLRFGAGANPAPFPSVVVVFPNAQGVRKEALAAPARQEAKP